MIYSGADLLVPAGIKCDGTSRHKQKHIYIGRVMKFGLFLGIFMSLKQFNVDIFILWVLWRYVWCFNILLMFGVVCLVLWSGIFGIFYILVLKFGFLEVVYLVFYGVLSHIYGFYGGMFSVLILYPHVWIQCGISSFSSELPYIHIDHRDM